MKKEELIIKTLKYKTVMLKTFRTSYDPQDMIRYYYTFVVSSDGFIFNYNLNQEMPMFMTLINWKDIKKKLFALEKERLFKLIRQGYLSLETKKINDEHSEIYIKTYMLPEKIDLKIELTRV